MFKSRVDFSPHASRLHEAGVLTLKKVTSNNTSLFASLLIASLRFANSQQIKITDREDNCNLSSLIITTFELSIVQIVGLGWLF